MAKGNGRETFRKVITSPELTEQIVGAFQQVIDATIFFGVGSPWTGFNGIVAVEQDVDVNYAVVIHSACGFCRAPQSALYLLSRV